MATRGTKERILDTAERLLAEHGFAGTSLRALTAEADVNLAAVNYHFGSKDRLVQEVFRRRLDRLNRRRLERLEALEDGAEAPELEAVLLAFIEPALELGRDGDGGGAVFVRVLARAYIEQSAELRQFLSEHYGHVMKRFVNAAGAAVPGIPADEFAWRMDFVVGALTYTMADFGSIKKNLTIADEAACRRVAGKLVAFAAAGLRAPPARLDNQRRDEQDPDRQRRIDSNDAGDPAGARLTPLPPER